MNTRILMLLAAAIVAPTVAAQQSGIGSVKIEPAVAKAGQEVKITVAADGEAPQFCGLRIEYGDSSSDDYKIDQSNKQFPVVVSHTYAKPGSYVVKARGKTVTTHMRCQGEAEAKITVEGAAAVPAAAAGPVCPAGYAMKGKAGKAGDFTCAAGKDAKKPEKVMDCADGLEYFQTKTSLGCRKAKK